MKMKHAYAMSKRRPLAQVFGADNVETLYSQHSDVFHFWGQKFSERFKILPQETVIDLGCRDGRFTRTLAAHSPHTQFHGLESNAHYLKLAQAHPSSPFIRFFNSNEYPHIKANHLVSCLLLHQLEDPNPGLEFIQSHLTSKAFAYLQICGDHKHERFDRSIFQAMRDPRWNSIFGSDELQSPQLTLGEFCGLCQTHHLAILEAICQRYTYYFINETEMMKWIVTWEPNIHRLSNEQVIPFLELCVENHLKRHPKTEKGLIPYVDHVFEIIAQKVN